MGGVGCAWGGVGCWGWVGAGRGGLTGLAWVGQAGRQARAGGGLGGGRRRSPPRGRSGRRARLGSACRPVAVPPCVRRQRRAGGRVGQGLGRAPIRGARPAAGVRRGGLDSYLMYDCCEAPSLMKMSMSVASDMEAIVMASLVLRRRCWRAAVEGGAGSPPCCCRRRAPARGCCGGAPVNRDDLRGAAFLGGTTRLRTATPRLALVMVFFPRLAMAMPPLRPLDRTMFYACMRKMFSEHDVAQV